MTSHPRRRVGECLLRLADVDVPPAACFFDVDMLMSVIKRFGVAANHTVYDRAEHRTGNGRSPEQP